MSNKLITCKTTREALKVLRLIAAQTGEKQYEVQERLYKQELDRVQKKGRKHV